LQQWSVAPRYISSCCGLRHLCSVQSHWFGCWLLRGLRPDGPSPQYNRIANGCTCSYSSLGDACIRALPIPVPVK
jgi:hypothetical protein